MADITLNFGKYRGMKLSECPMDYVRWLSEQTTICGKRDIPQAAKDILTSKPSAPVASNGAKECMYCRKPIHGEAVPVREVSSTNFKNTQVRTRYLHHHCAQELAEEE